jgi:hypothetical protein
VTDDDALVARYRRLRAVGRRLNNVLMEYHSRQTMVRAAKRLGLWHDGTIVFGTEHEMSVLADFIIYEGYEDGVNAVERYASEHPPAAGTDENTVLQAMRQAYYGLLLVEDVLPGVGVRVCDLLRDRRFLLADIGLSQTATEEGILATHVLPFDEFSMTSGAALPLDSDTLATIRDEVFPRDREARLLETWEPTREEEAEMAAAIIRLCLEAGASSFITDLDLGKPAASSHPPASGVSRPGRNDPCPCGSGKKYKKCCGRATPSGR